MRQLIDIQLDRLTPNEQRVLEAASVIGLELAVGLVASALEIPIEDVDELCEGLAERSLFLVPALAEAWPDGTLQTRYRVTHALVQEVCFERCAPARRVRWHKLIAEHLERVYGERSAEIAHVLATHFEHAQQVPRAVHYFVVASERTAQRFSNHDAGRLSRRAAGLLNRLPASTERDALELRILFGLSQAAVLHPDTALHEPVAMFERMIALARKLDDTEQLFVAMASLAIRWATLADYARAEHIGEALAALAQSTTIPDDLLAFADAARALSAMWSGRITDAIPLLEHISGRRYAGHRLFGILGATDHVALMMVFLGTLQWLRGEPALAFATSQRASAHAAHTGDPYTAAAADVGFARLHFWSGDEPAKIREAAERALAIPEGGVWHTQASLLVGAARAQTAPLARDEVDELLRVFRARTTPFPMGKTALALPMIEILRRSGHEAEAAAFVEEMLAFARARDERLLEAELVRLRGELVEPTDRAAAAAAYREAIEIARASSAHGLEQRAAASLAKLE